MHGICRRCPVTPPRLGERGFGAVRYASFPAIGAQEQQSKQKGLLTISTSFRLSKASGSARPVGGATCRTGATSTRASGSGRRTGYMEKCGNSSLRSRQRPVRAGKTTFGMKTWFRPEILQRSTNATMTICVLWNPKAARSQKFVTKFSNLWDPATWSSKWADWRPCRA